MNWRHLRRRLAAVRGVWDLAVLANLARGVIRPSDLIEAIRAQEGPISWTVLTRTLRRLEKEGYVGHKKVSQLPRVTRYWLTPAGWRLVRWLTQLDASCQETDPGDDHPAPPPQRGSAHPGR
jgi:DNA-binding HxlR family transcriptional regulator